ncbi:hypothetical protein GCM10022280_23130 [Sphingomonas swuensis]|uniref:histidine kinase n=1 Tax=Sphingomonas swuensis TaxID=977800 RepID=A0ABP7T6T9_9SPHN
MLRGLLTYLAYTLTAALGLQWAMVSGAASPIWPAAGVGVAAVCLGGRAMAVPIALGLVTASQLTGATHPLWSQLMIGIGNGAAAVVAAGLVRRFGGPGAIRFDRLRSVLIYLVGAVAAALLSAVVGVGALEFAGSLAAGSTAMVFQSWLVGDLVGIIAIGALLLAWSPAGARTGKRPLDWRWLPPILLLVAILSHVIFFGPPLARAWAVYPALGWASLALRARGALLSLLLVIVFAIAGTDSGFGPFVAGPDGAVSLLILQQFLAVTGATTLLLAATVDERDTEAELRAAGERELSARDELARFEAILGLVNDSAPMAIFAKDLNGRYLYLNTPVAEATGTVRGELLGRTDAFWASADLAATLMENDRAAMVAESPTEVEETLPGRDGEPRVWRGLKAPLRDSDGAIIGMVGVSTDITERKALEERERLLAREVDHRAKNLLAVVQSVVQLSRAQDADAFRESVVGRIQSLGRAHSLLSAGRWEAVSLSDLVVEELAPYALDHQQRVTIEGPDLQLRPAAAQSLALTLHELATNAVKYGALKIESGRLMVSWRRSEGGGLDLHWRELGCGPLRPSDRSGFGSRVIAASIERQLGGEVERKWTDDGLEVHLRLPAGQLARARSDGGEEIAIPEASALPAKPVVTAAPKRLLIVEDEALIGMEMERILTRRGFRLVGIATTVAEALALAEERRPDAALLDVNLAGEFSFPVAERLLEQGARVIFCTGYDCDRLIPPHLSHLAVVRKPIDPAEVAAALR